MKQLLILFIALLSSMALPAKATNYDSWTTYFAYHDGTDVIEADGQVYGILNGNLLAYDPKTTEVRTIDRLTGGLSSKGLKFLGYSDTQRVLVLLYADGNIDLYNVRNGRVTNIPQFKDNPDSNFALNSLKVVGDDAYIATAEGFVRISLKHAAIEGRYTIGGTYAVVAHAGRIYAAMQRGGVLSIALDDNLLDFSRWQELTPLAITDMGVNADCLYLLCPYTTATAADKTYGIYGIVGDGELSRVSGRNPGHITTCGGRAVVYQTDAIVVFEPETPTQPNIVVTSHGCNVICPASDGGYWTAADGRGITHYALTAEQFVADGNPITAGGPSFETPAFLRMAGDRLLMAAGRVDPDDRDNRPYHAAWLDGGDEWHDFEAPVVGGPWFRKNHNFENASSIVQDPRDPSHHFITSGRQGVFEYRNGKIVAQYTEGNSPIESCSASKSYDYVRTDGAICDPQGNLFVTNENRDTTLWCLKTDGKWVPFYNTAITQATYLTGSIFDRKGRLWVCQRRTDGAINGGFLCLDYNGTLDNTRDDVYTYRSSFTNQDGTAFPFQVGYCIAEDLDGRLWMGTDAGLVVCDNPDDWGNTDFLITQVKVPRNDGTNYADYLLAGAAVTAIAVDGANRKWIGTASDGIYLVASDGFTTLHHFTEANSPLVSDAITAIACHPHNGEVFIGTEKGLMSYHSDASEAEESLQRDNLRVYPNPVRPDYSGPVVLDGLVFDSDVKVVSTSGHVVAAGTSVGGTFTWDGRGPSGERVGSGVYYFMVATPDGKTTTVAKVAVVR